MSLFSTFNGIVSGGAGELLQTDIYTVDSIYTLPVGATHLFVKLWGSGGGAGRSKSGGGFGGSGGSGGYIDATINPPLTSSYNIVIGAGGSGGGPSDQVDNAKGGDLVYIYDNVNVNIIAVGSGGGGGNGFSSGTLKNGGSGGAGGLVGQNGANGQAAIGGKFGSGATSLAGGAGGAGGLGNSVIGESGGAGVFLFGGSGGNDNGAAGSGGSGGAGWYGGGGGGQGGRDFSSEQGGDGAGAGGGGGSNFGDISKIVIKQNLTGSGITPPNTSDIDYIAGKGVGGSPISGRNGNPGVAGMIVVQAWRGVPNI